MSYTTMKRHVNYTKPIFCKDKFNVKILNSNFQKQVNELLFLKGKFNCKKTKFVFSRNELQHNELFLHGICPFKMRIPCYSTCHKPL